MSHFDVFNGDADGICALQQLRLVRPRQAQVITGLKRDIVLLARVPARPGDTVTALDISLDRNRVPLLALLAGHVQVEYFDHHYAGELPRHPGLQLFIDTAPTTCTSLIVHRQLGGAHPLWAITGAFGDNQVDAANALAREAAVPASVLQALRELGEAINYNAYGEREADVLLPPAALYQTLRRYASPQDFLRQEPVAPALIARRADDLRQAQALPVHARFAGGAVVLLPDQAWARRVQGALANQLALQAPGQAHAVLRCAGPDAFMVNVRAPVANPVGADVLCLRFGGGGRARAAGIDQLPRSATTEFLRAFSEVFAEPRVGRTHEHDGRA